MNTSENALVISEVFAPDNIKWEKQDGKMPAPHDAGFAEGHAVRCW